MTNVVAWRLLKEDNIEEVRKAFGPACIDEEGEIFSAGIDLDESYIIQPILEGDREVKKYRSVDIDTEVYETIEYGGKLIQITGKKNFRFILKNILLYLELNPGLTKLDGLTIPFPQTNTKSKE